MGSVANISNDERSEAIASAQRHMDFVLGMGTGMVNPNAKVGSLSYMEKRKLVEAIVSGWIVERSRQLVADRLNEAFFLATGDAPEPFELGPCAAALPALGNLAEKMGLVDLPLGAWSKDQILQFIFTATELVSEARAARDERPGPMPNEIPGDVMMAG